MDASRANEVVRIDLTPAQVQVVKGATGHEAEALELTVQELEQRIAPKLASNNNETLLTA